MQLSAARLPSVQTQIRATAGPYWSTTMSSTLAWFVGRGNAAKKLERAAVQRRDGMKKWNKIQARQWQAVALQVH